MTTPQGQFVWYELMTTDESAAQAFYTNVIGWNASPVPNMPYTLFNAGDRGVGGMMAMPEQVKQTGGHPGWSGYIAVDDVDAYAAKVEAAGGSIHRPPDDIPTVGRFSVVADPSGAIFVLFKPNPPASPPPAPPAAGTPGTTGWHELHSGNWQEAFEFYSKLFGWKKTEALDMGPMGTYQLFATEGDTSVGGMMTKMEAMPGPPRWLYYFNVDAVDAAVERTKAAGGQVLMGPHQVPGGSWIVQGLDPQGAMFAVVGQQR